MQDMYINEANKKSGDPFLQEWKGHEIWGL